MRGSGNIIFLGPVTPQRTSTGRVTSWTFQYVQAATDPILLAYASQAEAHQARKELREVPNTYYVNQQILFDGIVLALNDAINLGKHQGDIDG